MGRRFVDFRAEELHLSSKIIIMVIMHIAITLTAVVLILILVLILVTITLTIIPITIIIGSVISTTDTAIFLLLVVELPLSSQPKAGLSSKSPRLHKRKTLRFLMVFFYFGRFGGLCSLVWGVWDGRLQMAPAGS